MEEELRLAAQTLFHANESYKTLTLCVVIGGFRYFSELADFLVYFANLLHQT